jgi:hypothetical protein
MMPYLRRNRVLVWSRLLIWRSHRRPRGVRASIGRRVATLLTRAFRSVVVPGSRIVEGLPGPVRTLGRARWLRVPRIGNRVSHDAWSRRRR